MEAGGGSEAEVLTLGLLNVLSLQEVLWSGEQGERVGRSMRRVPVMRRASKPTWTSLPSIVGAAEVVDGSSEHASESSSSSSASALGVSMAGELCQRVR
jgi:hypothetical protein